MRGIAIVFFVLAAVSASMAFNSVANYRANHGDEPGMMGYAAGSFVIPIVFLILGIVLARKGPKK